MKKIVLFLFIGSISCLSNGQTLLASTNLELKKSSEHHQAISFANRETNEVFVVASDKDNTTALYYNSAIFLKDSLKTNAPDKTTRLLSGYSFTTNNHPTVYWASEDYTKITAVTFDFTSKKVSEKGYGFDFTDETLLSVFSENNTFYVLTRVDEKDLLKFYVFEDETRIEKTVDLSDIPFYDTKNKPISLGKLLKTYPMQQMDTRMINPLSGTIFKSKFYVSEKELLLTLDHLNTETQVLVINLEDFTAASKSIAKPTLAESAENSNSFLQDGKLYQLKNNKDELVLAISDVKSGTVIQSHHAKNDAGIAFRNSPLFAQTGNRGPKDLASTKKFLKRLDAAEAGISVYNHRGDNFVTVGGQRIVATGSDVFLGFSVGVAGLIAGVDTLGLIEGVTYQVLYFETHFDPNGNYLKKRQEPLASDGISQFLYENRSVALSNSFAFKDHFILGYYDKKAEKYVLRKFEDF